MSLLKQLAKETIEYISQRIVSSNDTYEKINKVMKEDHLIEFIRTQAEQGYAPFRTTKGTLLYIHRNTYRKLSEEETLAMFERTAQLSLQYEVGNCQEKAYVAWLYLRKRIKELQISDPGIEISIIRLKNYTHTLIKMRYQNEVIFCDPWTQQFFHEDAYQAKIKQNIQDYFWEMLPCQDGIYQDIGGGRFKCLGIYNPNLHDYSYYPVITKTYKGHTAKIDQKIKMDTKNQGDLSTREQSKHYANSYCSFFTKVVLTAAAVGAAATAIYLHSSENEFKPRL